MKKIKRLMYYVGGRAITVVIGTLVLYIFADVMGYPSWLVNILWSPFALVAGFSITDNMVFKKAKNEDKKWW